MQGIPLSASEISSLTQRQLLHAVLQQSMMVGPFNDTKLWVFSRRRSDGVVDKAQSVYTNSVMLRAGSEYFDGFFNAGFSEDKTVSLCQPFPSDKPSSTTEYDYTSDSDLDDDETEQESSPDSGEEKLKHDAETSQVAGELFGRVIVIPDVAYRTLKAFVYYLYTEELSFAPLSSQPPKPSDAANSLPAVSRSPQCSPKSMYRFADKFGLTKLKGLAEADIRAKMSSENIVAELRSSFTSMYEPIRDMQVAFACESSRLPDTLKVIPEWLTELVTGGFPQAANVHVLVALFQKAVAAATMPATPTIPPIMSETQCSSCFVHSLLTHQKIYRYCSRCCVYRNPVA